MCFLPGVTDRIRRGLFFTWPNRIVERKIARFRAEVELPKELESAGRIAESSEKVDGEIA
jgi:hypothetical protein